MGRISNKIILTPARIASNNYLLDKVIEDRRLKNDAALCRALEVGPPTISKIRLGKQDLTDSTIIILMENFNYPLKKIRTWQSEAPPTYERTPWNL